MISIYILRLRFIYTFLTHTICQVGVPALQSYLKEKESMKGTEGIEMSEVEKTYMMVRLLCYY